MEELKLATPAEFEEYSWFKDLVDDLRTIRTEKEFESRWSLVEGYHEMGRRILLNLQEAEKNDEYFGQALTAKLSQHLGMSQRNLQLTVQFARKYPSLSDLPAGKNISWSKIAKEILPEKKETVEVTIIPSNLEERIIRYAKYLSETAKVSSKNIILTLPNEML